MNAEHFYEEFKSALNFLRVGFYDKGLVEVRINGDQLCMCFCGKEARITLPKDKEKNA